MIYLPLPVVVSLILCFVLVRGIMTGVARPLLILLALCAGQATLASINLITDNAVLRFAQIATASLIAAMTWVAYVTTTQRGFDRNWDCAHLMAGPLLVSAIGMLDAKVLDGFLTIWFAGHGIAILLSIAKGSDALPNVPLESAESARKLWIGTAIALLITAAVDLFIIVCVIAGFADWVPWIVTISSACVLLCLAVLGLAQPHTHAAETAPASHAAKPADEEATALFTRATALLETEKLYLDPDLNLTRLAHRLHVPVKKLSAAINQTTGESVSRLINGYRIKTVCADILDNETAITQAMFTAGFSTKSNFNTEFRRVTGQAPRQWLQNAKNGAAMQH
jgi:AraC-like DNA-binding protein